MDCNAIISLRKPPEDTYLTTMKDQNSSDSPAPPQWVTDLQAPPRPRSKQASNFPSPPGYSESAIGKRNNSSKVAPRKAASTEETDSLKLKKAWELALAPAKQLPMNAIMMYMSGNSLQIFSIMMVFMLFKNPLSGLLQTNEVFRRYETEGNKETMLAAKGCYVVMQFLALALGVWKVHKMGLLPTTRSDWLAWETEKVPLERAIFAF